MEFVTSNSAAHGAYSTSRSARDPVVVLADLRLELARVVHDVNNPLAVISGNAQLLVEMARMMELDSDLAKPISDIEEASRVLAEQLALLSRLKEQMRSVLDVADTL